MKMSKCQQNVTNVNRLSLFQEGGERQRRRSCWCNSFPSSQSVSHPSWNTPVSDNATVRSSENKIFLCCILQRVKKKRITIAIKKTLPIVVFVFIFSLWPDTQHRGSTHHTCGGSEILYRRVEKESPTNSISSTLLGGSWLASPLGAAPADVPFEEGASSLNERASLSLGSVAVGVFSEVGHAFLFRSAEAPPVLFRGSAHSSFAIRSLMLSWNESLLGVRGILLTPLGHTVKSS